MYSALLLLVVNAADFALTIIYMLARKKSIASTSQITAGCAQMSTTTVSAAAVAASIKTPAKTQLEFLSQHLCYSKLS